MTRFKKGDIVRCVRFVHDSSEVIGLTGIINEEGNNSKSFNTIRYSVTYKRDNYAFHWYTSEEALELLEEEYPNICEWE